MNTKLHINLKQGIVEAEGTESFVREVFERFNDNIGVQLRFPAGDGQSEHDVAEKKPKPKKANNRKPSRSGSDDLKVDKHLDLSGAGGATPLKDYYEKIDPKSNFDRNVVFVSYLKDQMAIEEVTIEHVWTCYAFLNLKLPGNMKQSLYDTSSHKGGSRLIAESLQAIDVSVPGRNWLREQQLGTD